MPGTGVIFENIHSPPPGAGIQNIFRNFRTSKNVIRVVKYVHKISRPKRPTMRLHGRVKRDCRQILSELGSKYRFKAEFSMNW
jgi:hypothetical protein